MVRVLLLMMSLWLPATGPAQADWLTDFKGLFARSGATASMPARLLAGRLAAASMDGRRHVLGAMLSQEGHWTFVNAAGETLTASTVEEVRRVVPMLGDAGGRQLLLVFDGETLFRAREAMAMLPQAEFAVALGPAVHSVLRQDGQFLVALRPSVRVQAENRVAFDEALAQLARPLNRSDIRVISLAESGPQTLARRPAQDAAGKPETDDIEALKLAREIGTLTGQVAVVTGRVEGNLLVYRLPQGGERSISLGDLVAAAARTDVDLVVLDAPAARQPGTRNWLWQRVAVAGLDQARERPTLADFLDAFASEQGGQPLTITGGAVQDGRVSLIAARGDRSAGGGVGGLVAGLAAEVTGRVVTDRAVIDLMATDRRGDLARRLLPGVPANMQLGYVALGLAGLIGLPFAWRWWSRIWPPEKRDDYAGAVGYRAAQAVKAVLFLGLFLPLAGLPAAVLQIGRWVARVRPSPPRRGDRPDAGGDGPERQVA